VVGSGGVVTGGSGGVATGGSGGVATGGSTTNGRRDGACQAGTTYPAPVLTGTPKQVYKPSAGGSGTYEGPVWLTAPAVLLLSDITFTNPINPSQLLKLTPPSTVATFLADAGTNGIALDAGGAIFACSHKVQGIVKLDLAAATLTTVVDNVGGKKFNSPNDLVIRSDGTIFFTDPDYQLGSRTSETGKKGVYRVSPAGAVSVVDDTFNEPNGIALSPDETVLYVADYAGNAVRTFAVAADGSTSGRKDFVTVSSPDGFGMDCLGNLYVASGGSGGTLQVYAPSGSKLGSVTVAASLSNVAFGGPDGKTLYLTAGKALYSLDMNLPGYWD
jgi:gluconolactonase